MDIRDWIAMNQQPNKQQMKLYFREDDDEGCYLKKDIIEYMEENGISSLKITEAKRITGIPYFWCTVNHEVGEIGQGCGKLCSQYKPRNSKSGRCKHSGYCYEPTEKTITLTT